MNAWVPVDACSGTPIGPPAPPGVPVTTTLYYTATAGQTTFSLSTPDRFGNTAVLNDDSDPFVYRSGNRLVYIDGYALHVTANSISLTYPAGAGEPIVFDLVSSVSAGPPGPAGPTGPAGPPGSGGGTLMATEVLTIATLNVIPPLSHAPDGVVLILSVNGTSFFAVGPQAAFTFSGNMLTWTSTLFSIPVGAAVIAVYSHA